METKTIALSALFMLATSQTLSAQVPQQLPLDPNVRTGVLENGLTYYLLRNNWPEGRTSFFIAQRVGSLQEEESQLGLAHFLEHMCFNGTENFPGNEVWDFVQRNGINNNAETAFDRTLYHIDNVPNTIGAAGMDSCLLILADWAHGLTLDASEINNERDVIHGEYRMRMQGAGRILLDELPNLYPGRYGQRYPIGKMEVVDNFEHKELVDYYHKWYNPENQAIIIVGDIDVDNYEKKVMELFGPMSANASAGIVEEYHVEPTTEVYYSMAKDKDLGTTILRYNVATPEIPKTMCNTANAMLLKFALNAAQNAMNYRFQDLIADPSCPIMLGQATLGSIVSEKINQFNIDGYPKEGQQAAAYALLLTELRRLVEYGLTQSEYDRFLQVYEQEVNDFEANKKKRDNSILAAQLASYYYYGSPFMDADQEILLKRQFIQAMPVQAINQMLPQLINTTGVNSSLWCWENEKEGTKYVTREELQEIFKTVQAAQIDAPIDNSIQEPLLSQLPIAGTIVSEEESQFGYKRLTLSNGVKVYIRQCTTEPNTISLKGWSKAGRDRFDVEELANYNCANDMPVSIGGWNMRQLQKLLAGKKVDFNMSLSSNHMKVNGTSGTKDLETMMQIAYMSFTNIGHDDEMYALILDQLRTVLPNRKTNTSYIFNDSVNQVILGHDPRYRSFEADDIESLNYDRMIEMMTQPMQNAANFNFVISGDYDEATLREFLCLYIASLPSKGVADSFRSLADRQIKQNTVCDFKTPMTEPKVLSQVRWINYQMPITARNTLCSSIVSRILSNAHFKKLREEMSACYTPYCQRDYELDAEDKNIQIVAATTGLKPELADESLAYTSLSIVDLCQTVSAEDLVKAQEELINSMHEARDTQLAFYEEALIRWADYGYDSVSTYEEVVKAQTPATIQQWVKEFLQGAVEVKIIARPE